MHEEEDEDLTEKSEPKNRACYHKASIATEKTIFAERNSKRKVNIVLDKGFSCLTTVHQITANPI